MHHLLLRTLRPARCVLRASVPLWLIFLAACSTVGTNHPGIQNFDQVSPTLFRGAQPTAEGFQTLEKLHVQTVINLRTGTDPVEAARAKNAGMTYLALPMDADQPTPADADRFLALLATVPAPIFVHCHAGRDRTGLAVAAYRLRIQHWSQQAALADLYAHGHYWALFPKIAATIRTLADPLEPPVALTPALAGPAALPVN